MPALKKDSAFPDSTDVGDVSWVTPTGLIMKTCCAFGTPGHSWQLVAQSGMNIGHKRLLYAGKVQVLTVVALMQDTELLARAQDEFAARLKDTPRSPDP